MQKPIFAVKYFSHTYDSPAGNSVVSFAIFLLYINGNNAGPDRKQLEWRGGTIPGPATRTQLSFIDVDKAAQ